MKYLSILILIALSACSNDDNLSQELPDCINELVNDTIASENIVTIQSQVSNDDQVYWINTNAVFFDGTEVIVSATCDTLCFYCGECIEPDCLNDYSLDDWVVIWEK
jgi:hypothetical protein